MKKKAIKAHFLKTDESFCDWREKSVKSVKVSDRSTIFRYKKGRYAWKGVKTEAYKTLKGDWAKIIRRNLIGDGLKTKSHVRYFEINSGGQSSFEKHRHEHIVIGIRGTGKVQLDKRQHKIKFLDVVYVSSNTPHQFINPYKEPFGFICIVPVKRDRPKILTNNK